MQCKPNGGPYGLGHHDALHSTFTPPSPQFLIRALRLFSYSSCDDPSAADTIIPKFTSSLLLCMPVFFWLREILLWRVGV